MFEHYVLRHHINLMGFRLSLTLYVDCTLKEVDLRLLVNGRIRQDQIGAPPKWWQVDTPEKAREWFQRIDLGAIAERLWLADKRDSRAA